MKKRTAERILWLITASGFVGLFVLDVIAAGWTYTLVLWGGIALLVGGGIGLKRLIDIAEGNNHE